MEFDKEAVQKEIMQAADCQKEITALRKAESQVAKLKEQFAIYQQRIKVNTAEVESLKIETRQAVVASSDVEKLIQKRMTRQNEAEVLGGLLADLEAVSIPEAEKAVSLARQKLMSKIAAGIAVIKPSIEAGLNGKLTEVESAMQQWSDLHWTITSEFEFSGLPGQKIYIQNRAIRDALGLY